jgi:fatty acid CoA ligase FadD9
MLLNHTSGHSTVHATLGCGGVGYFTAKSDLLTLFEDIRTARPTVLTLVPRVCEMLHQQYQSRLERSWTGSEYLEMLRHQILLELGLSVLGGRLLYQSEKLLTRRGFPICLECESICPCSIRGVFHGCGSCFTGGYERL